MFIFRYSEFVYLYIFYVIKESKKMGYTESKETNEKQKYNSIQLELFLWSRVHLMKLSDGTMTFTRARYVEDELFP